MKVSLTLHSYGQLLSLFFYNIDKNSVYLTAVKRSLINCLRFKKKSIINITCIESLFCWHFFIIFFVLTIWFYYIYCTHVTPWPWITSQEKAIGLKLKLLEAIYIQHLKTHNQSIELFCHREQLYKVEAAPVFGPMTLLVDTTLKINGYKYNISSMINYLSF